ncbi:MAG: hypothetical protein A2137_02090 [Chloroflexi bacterium RBG_16_58_8]|nr:MAG: hypothetical protein A2137_02090 [Chloroflexi bacterium RBG_16_58_8]
MSPVTARDGTLSYGGCEMRRHPYEYRVLVEYINPEEPERRPHFSHAEDQAEFTRMINEVFTHLPESVPEGWEVHSHNVAIFRNTLIVSVLLRRPVTSGSRPIPA